MSNQERGRLFFTLLLYFICFLLISNQDFFVIPYISIFMCDLFAWNKLFYGRAALSDVFRYSHFPLTSKNVYFLVTPYADSR